MISAQTANTPQQQQQQQQLTEQQQLTGVTYSAVQGCARDLSVRDQDETRDA